MKRFLYTILVICAAVNISCGQVIECSPEFPAYNTQNVVITFHADKGAAGLKGFTGDVYAHTGVIMKNSSSWTHVKYDWAVNKPDCKLTRTATNTYTLTISSVKDFYGLTETEAQNVDKLAFVFRSSDGKKEGKETGGKDIFLQIYEPSALNVRVLSPINNPFFVNAGENVEVKFSVSNDKATVTCNGESISGNTYNFTAPANGVHTLDFKAVNGNETATASLTCVVRSAAVEGTMDKKLHRGVNKTGSQSATFVLFAPNKKSAYVTGDFNNWSITNEATMKKDGDYFFCTVDNLDPEKEYAYQYIVDENIRIADPYTEKIIDPANDKYIPATVYPSLTCPDNADGILSTFRLNKKDYNWKNKSFTAAASKDLIIYEMLIRDFTTEGTIKAAKDKLDYLKQLGVNAIELMPFSEFEGNDSWGYNPSFYFAADKAYGTADDYKAFIDECHGRGIAVIQDIVLNHSYGQSPFVQLYFNSSTGKVTAQNPWYNVDSPNTVYSWGYDFNHESDETKALTDSIMAYWMTVYNVDGFRFDFTKGFTNKKATTDAQCSAYDASRIKILERIYDKIKSIKPSAIMICEHLTDNSEEKVLADYGIMLWGNMNYAFCQSTMGYTEGASTDWALASKRNFATENLVAYAESHDEERMMYKSLQYGKSDGDYSTKDFATAINRMKGAAAILLSIPGPKMIWQFGELGYEYSINYDQYSNTVANEHRMTKKPVPTYFANPNSDDSRLRGSLYDFYAFMDSLRINNDVMRDGSVNTSMTGLLKTVTRTLGDKSLVFVVNFNVTKQNATINFPADGTWHNIVGGGSIPVSGGKATVTLRPGETMIFSNNAADVRPDISTPVAEVVEPVDVNLAVYPNPCAEILNVSSDKNIENITLVSLGGAKVMDIPNVNSQSANFSINGLKSGVYFVIVKSGARKLVKKVMVK